MPKKTFKIQSNLVQALDETIRVAQNNAGQLDIHAIPINKIKLDEKNPRDLTNISVTNENIALKTLADSIINHGLINPILVYKDNDGYRLIAGHRRTLASILAKKSDIPAKILEAKPDDLQISQLQWIENIEREDLSLWERLCNIDKIVNAFKKIHIKTEITPTELATLLGCSLQQAINYNNISNSSAKLKNLIKDNKIKSIDKAATIAKSSVQLQPSLIEACLKGTSLKKLKQIASSPELKSLEYNKITHTNQNYTINLGYTKNIRVARLIIDFLTRELQSQDITFNMLQIDWNDYTSINAAIQELISLLDKHTDSLLCYGYSS